MRIPVTRRTGFLRLSQQFSEITAAASLAHPPAAGASFTTTQHPVFRTDAKIVRWPERYVDDRGAKMWQSVMAILADTKDIPPEEEVSETWTGTCPSHGTPAQSYF